MTAPEPLMPAFEAAIARRHRELEARCRSLEERRRFTEGLLSQVTTAILTADGSARVSFANRMALETLGIASDGCLGRDLLTVFGGSPELLAALRDVADSGERRIEFSLRSPGDRVHEIGMVILRASGEAPPDMAFVLLFRDLGDRRQFEMELRRIERLTAIGNMVAGFAHEVRNPLAGIQALAEALRAEIPAEDPRQEYAARILVLLARVERFIKASLQFGEPKPPQLRPHDPAALVAAALEALSPRWGRRGVPPAVEPGPELPRVEVDDRQLVECLMALLENALDSTQDPARVKVRLSCEPAQAASPVGRRSVRFEVVDDGLGIPPGLLSRVFDPFYTTKAKGTGLGLALAQTLVRENGGRLEVRSTVGLETVFSLVLPEAQG